VVARWHWDASAVHLRIPRLREVEFGPSWLRGRASVPEAERDILYELFVVLGDKRAILDWYERADIDAVTNSIRHLRQMIGDTLVALGPDAVSAGWVRDLRSAVHEYLDAVEHPPPGPEPVLFAPALRDLRMTVRAFALRVAADFRLESDSELVAEMDSEDANASPEHRRLWRDPIAR
jgi:hypothetical protein